MTIAIACNLADGLVLGVDSAVTIGDDSGATIKVFAEGEKWAPFWKRPIACIHWGVAALDNRTIRSYIREFETVHVDLDSEATTVEKLARALHAFLNEKYRAALQKAGVTTPPEKRTPLGLFVGGFGGAQYLSEVWEVAAGWDDPAGGVAQVAGPGVSTASWRGMTEGLVRLAFGCTDDGLREAAATALEQYSITRDPDNDAALKVKLDSQLRRGQLPFQVWGMPLNEGIEFVRFLLSVQTNMSRFVLKREGCGGRVRLILVTQDGVEKISHTPYTVNS